MAEKRSVHVEDTSDWEIVITRVFDAPRLVVWNAWTDPEQVVQWWGPRGFTTTIEVMDLRLGGIWLHTMHGPDGTDYPDESVFIEILKPERIVFANSGGEKGDPAVHFESTWTFEEQGNKTKLTIRMVFPSAAAREHVVKKCGAIEGGNQTLDRLGEHLAKLAVVGREFVIARTFDAPRELVFDAWSKSEHLARWWGPKGFTMLVAKLDFRPGGIFHYSMRSPDGHEMWGKFVYREIVSPERIVLINSFSNENGELVRHPMSPTWPLEMLSTFTFVEHDGKTTLTIRWSPYQATEAELKTFDDGRQGMNQGWTGTLDQLDAYLKKMTV
jgi:uncharacterized protein YndB with AHSA1/START domain